MSTPHTRARATGRGVTCRCRTAARQKPLPRAFVPQGPRRAKKLTSLRVSHMMTLPLASPALPLAAAGGEGLDYFEIVRNSGPVGMCVLALLLAASTVCWAIIAKKWLQVRRAQDESVKFLETFWQSKRLDAIYQAAERHR